jgi:hypothetical protein
MKETSLIPAVVLLWSISVRRWHKAAEARRSQRLRALMYCRTRRWRWHRRQPLVRATRAARRACRWPAVSAGMHLYQCRARSRHECTNEMVQQKWEWRAPRRSLPQRQAEKPMEWLKESLATVSSGGLANLLRGYPFFTGLNPRKLFCGITRRVRTGNQSMA